MRRKVFFLIGCIGLVIAVVFLVRYLANRGPRLGELRVDSSPSVNIFLNGKNLGLSPYREKVDAGTYVVKLIPQSATDQVVPWEGKISVGQNLLTYINAALSQSELTNAVDIVWLEKITSRQSELSVTTSPDGASVLVDNVTRGVTPLVLQDITAGEHTIIIQNSGYQTRTIGIRTTSGYRVIADFKLALAPGGSVSQETTSATASGTPRGKTATGSAAQKVEPAKPYIIIKETPTGFLRVRSEPSTTATESGRVNPGEKYSIVDSRNGWYEIQYDPTTTGWVSGQYTEKVE